MRKILITLVLVVLLASTVTACAKTTSIPAPAPEAVSWSLYSYVSRSHSFCKELITFAEDVEAKSGGRLKIRVFGVDELTYKGTEFLRLLRDGSVESAQVLGPYVAGDAPMVVGPALPFLNPTRKYQATLKMADALGNLLEETLGEWNSVVVGRWTYPEQNIWLAKPINTVDELKGLKIRTYGPDITAALEALGAAGVTMAAGEVYTALQRGVMDGAYTAPVTMLTMSWNEVCKQGWRTKAAYPVDRLLVNRQSWDALSPELQQIVRDCTVALAEREQSYSVGEVLNGQLADLKAAGMDIREVSDAEYEEMAEMAKSAWHAWAKRTPNGEEGLKRMAEAVGRKL